MPSFTYYPAIPQSSDVPSNSQSQFLTNFGSINSIIAVDHVTFGSADNTDGEHNQVTFAHLQSPVTPTDPVSILYTKNDSASHPQLFFLNSQNSGQTIISSTGSIPLLGGIVMKWGTINFSSSSKSVSFSSNFLNNVYSLVITSDTTTPATNGIISFSSLTTSGFTAYQNSGGSTTAYYIAIGN